MRSSVFALLLSVIFGFGSVALAATPFKRSLGEKKNTYLRDGVFVGGKAGNGTTLVNVRRAFSSKVALERVIVDLADNEGRAPDKYLGYFQASVDAGQNRIVLDLAQLKQSRVSERKIREAFKGSPYVASVEFTLDPEDKAGTMVLNLKRPMQLEVFQMIDGKKPGRIVMDLTPARATAMKGHL